MTVRIYQSTDASAPVLTGTVGALTALLDAVLVNGYGSKTAAGWSIAYTTTNKRVYTMASGGTGFSVYIDDTGPGAGAAREARATGFEVPSGLGTGTGQFPTAAQSTIGIGAVVIRKSTTADSTARPWFIVADGHTFYLFADTGDFTGPSQGLPFYFGDFFSYSPTDSYNCAIIGRMLENTGASNNGTMNGLSSANIETFSQLNTISSTPMAQTINGHFVVRNFNGVGGSLPCGKHSDCFKKGVSGGGGSNMGRDGYWSSSNADAAGAFPYPAPPNAGLFCSPVWLHHGGFPRGYLKGLWDPLHYLALNHWDTFSGSGNMAGKSLIAVNIPGVQAGNSFVAGLAQCVVEYSDTWS